MSHVDISLQFRQDFPFFSANPEWTYLDSAATTLKPRVLLNATSEFYASAGSVHRSQYDLPQTTQFEQARQLVAERFNIESPQAVIWTSGTTHAINLVAQGLAHTLRKDDEIVISIVEHHANFIPWQQLAQKNHAKLIILPVNSQGEIEPSTLEQVLTERTKIVAFNLVSNVSGVRQEAEALIPIIRQKTSAKILLDIAQAVCSEPLDLQALDADFYAFSAHKMYGPTGVGVLTGKLASLAQLSPLFFGGKMLEHVSERHLTLAKLPYRLEAGTPNIAGIIGFGEVLKWLNQWDFTALTQSLYTLSASLRQRLEQVEGVKIIGNKVNSPTISFTFKALHHADIAAIFTEMQVALRVGEHCAKPYLHFLQENGTLRISLVHYNTATDIERFFSALETALSILRD